VYSPFLRLTGETEVGSLLMLLLTASAWGSQVIECVVRCTKLKHLFISQLAASAQRTR
jgi:hypothetical protein